MTPAAVEALEGALRLRNRFVGVGEYPDPARHFDEGGFAKAAARCAEANRDLMRFLLPGTGALPRDARRDSESRDLETWSFLSPLPFVEDDRVVVRVHRRAKLDPHRPAILFHHPLFQKRWEAWDWFLAPLVERAPVAMMAAPYHFRRTPRGEFAGEGYVNPNPWRLYSAVRQWMWDQAAARVLLEERLGLPVGGVVGFSLGAFQSLLLGAAGGLALPIVSIACTNRYGYGVFNSPIARGLREALARLGIDRESFERAVDAMQLERWAPRLRGRPVLWIAGRHDRVDPPPSSERLERALRPARSLHVDAGHATLVLYRAKVQEAIGEFFEECGVIAPRERPPQPRRGARSGGSAAR
jgi:hypothetical protein